MPRRHEPYRKKAHSKGGQLPWTGYYRGEVLTGLSQSGSVLKFRGVWLSQEDVSRQAAQCQAKMPTSAKLTEKTTSASSANT